MKDFLKFNLILLLIFMTFAGCSRTNSNPLALSISPEVASDKVALDEFISAGVRIVELTGVHNVIHNDADFYKMKVVLQSAGMQMNSIHYPYGPMFDISNLDEAIRLGALKEIEFYLGRLAELDGKYLIVHPSFEPVPAIERVRRLKACRKSILELNEIMKEYPGMIIAMEDLPRTCLGNTADELNGLIADTCPDRIGICLDTNHMLQEDLITFSQKTAKRIVTVHISDYDAKDERHWFPGQGINDWHGWFKVMCQAGYKGPMLYEVTWPIARGQKLTPRQMAALIKLNYNDYFKL
ncbi:MAG: sugar phosphate isomerase/epimerase [Phycisphaerae bacterium]|nr:sugar phosphate isomerase/epimerase [Phycisphaerae bacterium]